jgi:hypothetical protein
MATHRPHDTVSAHGLELVVGVLDACEDLEARRRPITPASLARWLRARSFPFRPTPAQIEHSLARLQRWRTGPITRDLLDRGRQLAHHKAALERRRRDLERDRACLDQMIARVERLLLAPEDAGPAALTEPATSQGRSPSLQ